MMLEQRLQLKLSQKLLLTPALVQSIQLLPLATVELVDLLNQEVVENPLLEEVSAEELHQVDAAAQVDTADPELPPTRDNQDTWDDADYAYFFGEYLDGGYRPKTPREFQELPPFENTLSTVTSLSDHLTWQLSAAPSDELVRGVGAAIIGNLDKDGYLLASIDELATMGHWPEAEVERILSLVQAFDPIGVAARDLQECLLIQLRHFGLEGTPSEVIVRDHLALLERGRLPELGQQLGLPIDEIQGHLNIIRDLNPTPGIKHNPSPAQHVIPDVYVRKVEGEYLAVPNEDGLPSLKISPVYRRMLDKTNRHTPETRAYVKDKFRSALWLIKSVDQRRKTIHKVATSIITFQRAFLDHGIEHLRPLVLRDVATDIGMHESTVSRVVNDKYMHTPQGVLEMKYFFHSGVISARGESVSSVTIKRRIRQMIAAEDSRKPLSDSRIASALREQGLVLARRTISKYREEDRIPTSSRRRAVY
jgi:RNA polymerase sigma-54 factor